MKNIFLVGFMGSGKTSIGRELANYLHYQFIDLDDLIIQQQNCSISEIFSRYSEAYFREIEHTTLKTITNLSNTVVALGGGTYISSINRDLIQQQGISVWLQCDLTTILSRLANDKTRPLYKTPEQMKELLDSRIDYYNQANFKVNVTNFSIKESVIEIIRTLELGSTN